jgi:hypothetical protein
MKCPIMPTAVGNVVVMRPYKNVSGKNFGAKEYIWGEETYEYKGHTFFYSVPFPRENNIKSQ